MKRSSIILLAAGILTACGPRPEATLDATVVGIVDGTKVVLLDSDRTRVDSTTVAGGKFHFDIAKARPDQAILSIDGAPGLIPFFVEPGAIAATIDMTNGPTFSGTVTNDAAKAFQDGLIFAADREKYRVDAVMGAPASVFSAYLIYSAAHAQTTPAEIDSLLAIIADAPANAFTDRLVERRELLAASAVGVQAPDFTQAQPDGTPLTLSELRGKLVLIDFWASWCGPCRMENPNVVKLYERFKDRGFEILGVSLDDNREAWLKAIADDGLTWRHVSDIGGWQNAVAEQYAVRSIPHTVLVSPEGVILAKNLRGAALEAKVAEILD